MHTLDYIITVTQPSDGPTQFTIIDQTCALTWRAERRLCIETLSGQPAVLLDELVLEPGAEVTLNVRADRLHLERCTLAGDLFVDGGPLRVILRDCRIGEGFTVRSSRRDSSRLAVGVATVDMDGAVIGDGVVVSLKAGLMSSFPRMLTASAAVLGDRVRVELSPTAATGIKLNQCSIGANTLVSASVGANNVVDPDNTVDDDLPDREHRTLVDDRIARALAPLADMGD